MTRGKWWLAALVLLLAADVHAKATPSQKCRALKTTQIGKHALCRLKADAKAVRKLQAADYAKCDNKLVEQYSKIESKFGSACPTLNDASDAIGASGECTFDLSCTTLVPIRPPASVIAVQDIRVSDTEDTTIILQNTTALVVNLLCLYLDYSCEEPFIDFRLELAPSARVEWLVSEGRMFNPHYVPGLQFSLSPFSGDLVCVEIDNQQDQLPVSNNSLKAFSKAKGQQCPHPSLAFRGNSSNNQDSEIVFGTEYDPCPPDLDRNVVESCWSIWARGPNGFVDFRCDE